MQLLMRSESMNMPDSIPEEMLSAYLDGELSSSEREEVERALEHDGELRALLADLKRIRTEIQRLPRHELSIDFAKRVTEAAVASAQDRSRAVTPNDTSVDRGGKPIPRPRTYASRVRMVVGTIATAAAIIVAISALPKQGAKVGNDQVAMNPQPNAPVDSEAVAPTEARSLAEVDAQRAEELSITDDFGAGGSGASFADQADRFQFGDDNAAFQEAEDLQRSDNLDRTVANSITPRARFPVRSPESIGQGFGGMEGNGVRTDVDDLAVELQSADSIQDDDRMQLAPLAAPPSATPPPAGVASPSEVAAVSEALPDSDKDLATNQLAQPSRNLASRIPTESLRESAATSPVESSDFDAVLYVSLPPAQTAESLTEDPGELRMLLWKRDDAVNLAKEKASVQLSADAKFQKEVVQPNRDDVVRLSESRLKALKVPEQAELLVLEGPPADVLSKLQALGPQLGTRPGETDFLSSKANALFALKSRSTTLARSARSRAQTSATAAAAFKSEPDATGVSASAAKSYARPADASMQVASKDEKSANGFQPRALNRSRAFVPPSKSDPQGNVQQASPNEYLRVLLVVQPEP